MLDEASGTGKPAGRHADSPHIPTVDGGDVVQGAVV
jgi:hypothetical protein